MRRVLTILGAGLWFCVPGSAGHAASEALTREWQDLHGRCEAAVTRGAKLDLMGLEGRLPNFTYQAIDGELFGPLLVPEVLGPGGRTAPTGVWGMKGGRFELWLIEYPTRAGFRAICEVRQARGMPRVTVVEAQDLRMAYKDNAGRVASMPITVSRPGLTAFRLDMANPRGCPVVTSFSAEPERGALRSSVSEAVGAPECGGPSLARNVITPHGILPPKGQGG